jgi:hypothetical protein
VNNAPCIVGCLRRGFGYGGGGGWIQVVPCRSSTSALPPWSPRQRRFLNPASALRQLLGSNPLQQQEYQPILTLFGSDASDWSDYIMWYNSVTFHHKDNDTIVEGAVGRAKANLQRCVVGNVDDMAGTLELLR